MSNSSGPAEILPEKGLVFAECKELQLVLCQPKLLPIKSYSLERLERMEKKIAGEAKRRCDIERAAVRSATWTSVPNDSALVGGSTETGTTQQPSPPLPSLGEPESHPSHQPTIAHSTAGTPSPVPEVDDAASLPDGRALDTASPTMSVSASTTTCAADGGGVARRKIHSLPAHFPSSALIQAIEDEHTINQLRKQEQLRLRRDMLRDQLRQLRMDQDDAHRRSCQQTDASTAALNDEITRLNYEKDSLHTELEELQVRQRRLLHLRDSVSFAASELRSLEREIHDLEKVQREMQQRPDGNTGISRSAGRLQSVAQTLKALEVKVKERDMKQSELIAHRSLVDQADMDCAREHRSAKYVSVRERLTEVISKLAIARSKRQGGLPDRSKVDAARQQQDDLRHELQDVDRQLEELRTSESFFEHFTYPEELKMELVGRGGATLRQLQLDFGVALLVDTLEAGNGFLVGAPANRSACLAAIQVVLTVLPVRQVVPFPRELRSHLIGIQGANILVMEQMSGARLDVRQETVEITGLPQAVRSAVELIANEIHQHYSEAMRFQPQYMHIAFGKGGATVRDVKEKSGVRVLRIDRERSEIRATGTESCVAEALRLYRELFQSASSCAWRMRCDESFVRTVIGAGGRTVQGIEETTGAKIMCGNDVISVTGRSEEVEEARKLITDLRQVEVRVSVDKRAMDFVSLEMVEVVEESGEGADELDSLTETPSSRHAITALAAIQRVTDCAAVRPLRAEKVILFRGKDEQVNRGVVLLKQLFLRHPLRVQRVTYLSVLGPAFSRPTLNGKQRTTRLDAISRNYSRLLHISNNPVSSTLEVSSYHVEELQEAVADVVSVIKGMEAHVHIITPFPASKMRQLIGPQGATIQALQVEWGVMIAVERELQQVQVYRPDHDTASLQGAVKAICDLSDVSHIAPMEQ